MSQRNGGWRQRPRGCGRLTPSHAPRVFKYAQTQLEHLLFHPSHQLAVASAVLQRRGRGSAARTSAYCCKPGGLCDRHCACDTSNARGGGFGASQVCASEGRPGPGSLAVQDGRGRKAQADRHTEEAGGQSARAGSMPRGSSRSAAAAGWPHWAPSARCATATACASTARSSRGWTPPSRRPPRRCTTGPSGPASGRSGWRPCRRTSRRCGVSPGGPGFPCRAPARSPAGTRPPARPPLEPGPWAQRQQSGRRRRARVRVWSGASRSKRPAPRRQQR